MVVVEELVLELLVVVLELVSGVEAGCDGGGDRIWHARLGASDIPRFFRIPYFV